MLEQFCDWLSTTRLSLAFQSAEWFVPLVQTVHIICIAALIIPVFQMSYVLVRKSNAGEVSRTVLIGRQRARPLLLTLLVTGVLLSITEPARELLNWAFRTKMIMVLALVLIIYRLASRAREGAASPLGSQALNVAVGVTLGLLVVAIITAGRWIAYT